MTRILEIYTTNKKTIINLMWRTLQTFGMHGISLVFFLFCSYYFSTYEFGIYNYVLTIVFFFMSFANFGVSHAAGKYVAEYNNSDKAKLSFSFFNSGLIILIFSTLVIIFVVIAGVFIFPENYQYLILLLPLFLFYPGTFLLDGVYTGLQKFKKASLIFIAVGIVAVGIAWFLISKYDLKGAFVSWNIFYFLLFLSLLIFYRGYKIKFNKEVIKEIGSYSMIIGVSGFFYFLSSRADVLIIGHFDYINEIGYFEIIHKSLFLLLIPFTIIGQVISPAITRYFTVKNYNKVINEFIKFVVISLVLSIFLILIFILFNKYIYSNYFEKYYCGDMSQMVLVMLPYIFTSMMIHITSFMAVATGHAKFCMWFIMIVGIINIIADYIFILFFGFWGLMYSTVSIKSISYLLFIYLYYRILSKYQNKESGNRQWLQLYKLN